ncbi:archaetidylserine decarboxylase [Marinicella sp. S1101]|uniref:archaetidylserine decarboxylase n=1 Tax=Marinicella marina TaxID=2996016 RepID=UPI002260AA78|nr:archaetidylserine decarboxylase [Marinicella marina]MCX7554435.1 archaetidylserine decarboxylase [Marinicella marina]MDJ1140586.1 archaetidylserine decarboxylase [Marinicella marina]
MKQLALVFQYILPHRLLSRLMYYLMRIRFKPIKNMTLNLMINKFNINLDEAASKNYDDYEHFNAFFTRALKDGTRPIDESKDSLVSPVDGVISQMGAIEHDAIFQAKGHHYSISDLLATEMTEDFIDGQFMTIYLSPKDYHRLHAPLNCDLKSMRHVPGRLFSVADWTTQKIPRLFARNERLINHLHTPIGHVAYVYVGAILVSSIETVSNGVITPPYASQVTDLLVQGQSQYKKGEEMGRFNMGSTVVLLFPKNTVTFETGLQAGSAVKLGEKIASLNGISK